MDRTESEATRVKVAQITTHGPEETRRLGAALASRLGPGDVLALVGELGTGKTNFVKGLARGLGIKQAVHSPTFILANEYRSGRLPLFHVDAYRVQSAGEAFGFGIDDYINDAGVTVIEWADRVAAVLPREHIRIEFGFAGELERNLAFIPAGESYRRRVEELFAASH